MGIFKELVIKHLEHSLSSNKTVFSFPYEGLNKHIGDIKSNDYNVITGRTGSGKTSFLDHSFVLNLYIQWKQNQVTGDDRKFKILYFSLNHTKQLKLQKWATLIMQWKHNVLSDINTLNNESSKLVNIDDEFKAQLEDIESFFDAMLETEIIEIIEGQKTPSEIVNEVDSYMDSIGSDVEGNFLLDTEYENGYYGVVIDSTDRLLTESTSYGFLSNIEMLNTINEYALKFKNYYKISTTIVHPTAQGNIRGPKDTEPKYTDLGPFAQDCDRGFAIYSPFTENNNNYLGLDVKTFVSKTGINRLRILQLVRNKIGSDGLSQAMGFYPENGLLFQMPSANSEEYLEALEALYNNKPV